VDYRAKRLPTFTELGTFGTHIFYLFSQHVFSPKFKSYSVKDKKSFLFKFFVSQSTITNDMPTFFVEEKQFKTEM